MHDTKDDDLKAIFETWRTPDPVQWTAIAYLCVNTVVAYWSFAESLRHIDASTAAAISSVCAGSGTPTPSAKLETKRAA